MIVTITDSQSSGVNPLRLVCFSFLKIENDAPVRENGCKHNIQRDIPNGWRNSTRDAPCEAGDWLKILMHPHH